MNALNKNNFSDNINLVNKINLRSKENTISTIEENKANSDNCYNEISNTNIAKINCSPSSHNIQDANRKTCTAQDIILFENNKFS